jgi:hypothetical protein
MEMKEAEEKFKKELYTKGKINMSLEIRFIGFYKVKILMAVIKLLNIIVIPNMLINKNTKVIDCHFEIK